MRDSKGKSTPGSYSGVEDPPISTNGLLRLVWNEIRPRSLASAWISAKQTAHYLGIGISNLIVGLSPQAVVVSGIIAEAWDIIADELYCIAERSVRGGLPKTILMASSLGDSPTLIGSLSLVLAKKFGSAS